MGNLRFLYNNLWDTADLTASSEVATLPVKNTVDPRLECKYRSISDSSTNVVANLGSAQAITAVAIAGHNISSSVTNLRLQAHTSDSWGTPDVNINLLNPYGSYNTYNSGLITWQGTLGTKRYWRILIEDAFNPDEYISLGRIFLGSYFEPIQDKDAYYTLKRLDLSEISMSLNGTKYVNQKNKIWQIQCQFPDVISDPSGIDDYQSFLNMFDNIGTNKDIFISINPDQVDLGANRYCDLQRHTFYGKLLGGLEVIHNSGSYYQININFEESI